MIARVWRGWAEPGRADAYEMALREDIIPSIEARQIPGLLHIDVLKRIDHMAGSQEVEFSTIFWFAAESDIAGFVGDDITLANLPEAARAILSRWDDRAIHYDVREQRPQL